MSRMRYEPYGAPTTGSQAPGPGYTGHVWDDATGLSYMQQRYYDPIGGRFLSTDPIAASANSFNRYAYANNNPYRYIDPDGREACGGDTTCRLRNGAYGGSSEKVYGARDTGEVPKPTIPGQTSTPAPSQPKSFEQKAKDFVQESWEEFLDKILPAAGPYEAIIAGGGKIFGAAIIGGRISGGATNANRLYHIFGQAKHNLGSVVKEFGSEEAAFNALKVAAEGVVKAQGITGVFERVVQVGAAQVTVRGNVSNGAVQIGTAFIP